MSSYGPSTLWNIAYRIHHSRFIRHPESRLWVWGQFAYLKHHLSNFAQVNFFRCQGCRKWVRMTFQHLETLLHRLHQSRFLRRTEGRLWVLRAIRLLKAPLKWLRPSRFFRGQDEQICSHCPSTPYIIATSTSKCRPEARLLVLRAISLFETSLPLLRPNRFLEYPECRKCLLIAFRHHETLLHQHHQSLILRCSESRLWALWFIRIIKTSH
jgi:hypothetical protein